MTTDKPIFKKIIEPKWFAIPLEKFPASHLNHKEIGKMNWDGHAYVLVSAGFLQRNPAIARQFHRRKHPIKESGVRLPHFRKRKRTR